MRKYLYALIFLPLVFFAAWIGGLEYKRAHAPKVVVAAMGYDPVDLFRGHYLWLQPDWSATDCAQFPDGKCQKARFNHSYRFYLNETKAIALDAPVRSAGRGAIGKVEMVFFYDLSAAPMLDKVLIDGIPYDEWYDRNMGK